MTTTVEEAAKAKLVAEGEIMIAIRKFQLSTNLTVQGVDLIRSQQVGVPVYDVIDVRLDVRL